MGGRSKADHKRDADARTLKAEAFAELHRDWKTGNRIDLELPLKMRLEAVDKQHPETVALLCGPLVLMSLDPKALSFAGPRCSQRRGTRGLRVFGKLVLIMPP